MFERFTEKARRVIFYARYEASQCGAQHIETTHLLIALVQEDRALLGAIMGGDERLAELRTAVEAMCEKSSEKIATSVDMPLNHPAKRALAYAAEESKRAGHTHIGTIHLLAGLVREKGPETSALQPCGITLENVREWMNKEVPPADPQRRALHRLLDTIPDDRLKATAQLLEIAKSERFDVTALTPAGSIRVVFPEAAP